MEAHEINPFIRYAELRTCSVSYKTPVCAYDYRIFIMKEGECTVVVDEGVLSLCKDCCLIIPPGRAYRFLFNVHAPAIMYNINFSLSYLPGNGRALRPDMPERFRSAHMPEQPDPAFFPVTTLIENVSSDIGQYAADLLAARDGRELFFNEICSALLKCILLRLRRMPREGGAPDPRHRFGGEALSGGALPGKHHRGAAGQALRLSSLLSEPALPPAHGPDHSSVPDAVPHEAGLHHAHHHAAHRSGNRGQPWLFHPRLFLRAIQKAAGRNPAGLPKRHAMNSFVPFRENRLGKEKQQETSLLLRQRKGFNRSRLYRK